MNEEKNTAESMNSAEMEEYKAIEAAELKLLG